MALLDPPAPTSEQLTPSVRRGVAGGGRPLDPGVREVLGRRLGSDFRQVRIHTDAGAGESARRLSARAYTVGRDIAFAPGEYRPDTERGQRLLAHELAHVVQQGRGGAAPSPSARSPLDAAAEQAASSALDAGATAPAGGGSGIGIARQAERDPVQWASQLSDPQLEEEIALRERWLRANPTSSPERAKVEQEQSVLVWEQDMRLSQRTPVGWPLLFGPVHLRPYYKDPAARIRHPILRQQAEVTTRATFGGAMLGRNLAAATAAALDALFLAGMIAPVAGEGAIGGAVGVAEAAITLVGEELVLLGGSLQALGSSALVFYLSNALLVNELALLGVGMIMSVDGDLELLINSLQDPVTFAILMYEIWVIHAVTYTPNGASRRVRIEAEPLPLEEQIDPTRLRLRTVNVEVDAEPATLPLTGGTKAATTAAGPEPKTTVKSVPKTTTAVEHEPAPVTTPATKTTTTTADAEPVATPAAKTTTTADAEPVATPVAKTTSTLEAETTPPPAPGGTPAPKTPRPWYDKDQTPEEAWEIYQKAGVKKPLSETRVKEMHDEGWRFDTDSTPRRWKKPFKPEKPVFGISGGFVEQEAGRVQEKVFVAITGWPANTKNQPTSYGTRRPDYLVKPGAKPGEWVTADTAQDAVLVADSKYYDDGVVRFRDDAKGNQLKGFIELASKTSPPSGRKQLLLMTNENATIATEVIEWAQKTFNVTVVQIKQTRSR